MNNDFEYNPLDGIDDESGFDRSGVDSGIDDDSVDFTEGDLKLGFVRYVGTESGKVNLYEFIFTTNPDEFWGVNFEYKPAGISNGVEPDSKYFQKVERIRTILEFDLIQDSGCFSMQDSMDGIVALAWENIDHYDEYPEHRIYVNFGESYHDVESKLALKHILFSGGW